MTRTIFCKKLQQDAEGFDTPPYPGELGQKIYDSISKTAWDQWLGRQTMLINEYRLSLIDPKARQFLETECERFLFGDGGEMPSDFTPREGH